MSNAAGPHQYQGMQQPHGGPSGVPPPADLSFQHEDGEEDDGEEDDDAPAKGKGTDKKAGRRKIKIEFINDKSRRHITFSKRKAGIMKKVRAASPSTSRTWRDYVSPRRVRRPTRQPEIVRSVLKTRSSITLPSADARHPHLVRMLTINAHHLPFQAYELSTLTGTQVLLLVVSETGLVYTFTTAKLQPLVTQPEGKNLIQACLNSPAGTVPTGAPLGVPGNTVHQANVHQPPPHMNMPMPPPPNMGGQQVRNVPGGLSIDPSDQGRDDEDDEGDEEGSGGRDDGSESPPSSAVNMQPPSQLPHPGSQQRHTSHHGAPGHARATASTPLSAHGAHHTVHPYGGGAREAHQAHRRKASGSNGKVTSPRLAMQTRSSGMGVVNEGGPDGPPMQSPTVAHGHDPNAAMYGYPQQGGNPQMPQHYQYPGMPPTGWQGMPQGAPQAHRR